MLKTEMILVHQLMTKGEKNFKEKKKKKSKGKQPKLPGVFSLIKGS